MNLKPLADRLIVEPFEQKELSFSGHMLPKKSRKSA